VAHTIKLNVGGIRARLWVYLPATDDCRPPLLGSNVGVAPVDMYRADIDVVPSVPCPALLSEGLNGLWKGIGARSVCIEVLDSELARCAWLTSSSCVGASRIAEMSTRSSGHGIPWLESVGSEGDVRIAGSGCSFLDLRRKNIMARQIGWGMKEERRTCYAEERRGARSGVARAKEVCAEAGSRRRKSDSGGTWRLLNYPCNGRKAQRSQLHNQFKVAFSPTQRYYPRINRPRHSASARK